MSAFLLAIALNLQMLFFNIVSLLGISYAGSESSPIYMILHLTFALVSILQCLYMVLFANKKIKIKNIILLSLPLIVFILSLLTRARYGYSSDRFESALTYSSLWMTSGICIGVAISLRGELEKIIKWLDLFALIITLGTLSSVLSALNTNIINLGGSTYQALSYNAAYAFGINMFFLSGMGKGKTFKLFEMKQFMIIRIFLSVLLVINILYSGGRGGFVLLIVYLIFYLGYSLRKDKRKMLKLGFIILVIGVCMYVVLPNLLEDQFFYRRITRTFSYIDSGGIDMSQSSGRDKIYTNAINSILQKPVFGYGILGTYYALTNYPHNIILEILLEGGVLYLSMWLVILVFLFRKYIIILKDQKNLILFVLIIYQFTHLMFSGTFMSSPIFWFIIGYVFSFEHIKKQETVSI